MGFAAVLDIKPHRFQNTSFRSLNSLPEAINTGKVFAVGVVVRTFLLDRDGVGVESHGVAPLTARMINESRRARPRRSYSTAAAKDKPSTLTTRTQGTQSDGKDCFW